MPRNSLACDKMIDIKTHEAWLLLENKIKWKKELVCIAVPYTNDFLTWAWTPFFSP